MSQIAWPSLGVIIPIYGHPVLLPEAIYSLENQTISNEIVVVIVNDGCSLEETDAQCLSLANRYDEVYYLKKRNGGPSSARNVAMDFLAEKFPDLEAIMFLDADNRLGPTALECALRELRSNPEIDWIYPQISAFEMEWHGDYTPTYSQLLHITHENICDTGSMLRCETVGRLRFNEDRSSGFEDWDFWLNAISKGYRGRVLGSIDFEYRNRAESRFKETNRARQAIEGYLRKRYKKEFTPKALLQLSHVECPRFSIFDTATHQSHSFTDPLMPIKPVSLSGFTRNFWASQHEVDKFHVPPTQIIGNFELLCSVARVGLMSGLLWRIEQALRQSQIVIVRFETSIDEFSISTEQISRGQTLSGPVSFLAMRSSLVNECVQHPDDNWLLSLNSHEIGPSVTELHIATPGLVAASNSPGKTIIGTAVVLVSTLRQSEFRSLEAGRKRYYWRTPIFPACAERNELLERYFGVDGILPYTNYGSAAKNVAFVVPIASYGGSEKVAYAVAIELKKLGYKVHLFVVGGGGYKFVNGLPGIFDQIVLLGEHSPEVWGGSGYGRGNDFHLPGDPAARVASVKGLLCTMDAVVNCQSAPMNSCMGELKSLGIFTASYVHLFDQTEWGREVGHPYLTLLFEHAYNAVLTCSDNLKNRLHGYGMPGEKLICIPNAPSFSIDEVERNSLSQLMFKRSAKKQISIAYIGRLDRQKGVERTMMIYEFCRKLLPDAHFKFIGSNLVETASGGGQESVEILPPIFDPRELKGAFLETDLLLLPSRWEGAPLVILEAQQCGCVPIATDVGAVSELIVDGEDGVVVPTDGQTDSDIARFTSEVIFRLAGDRKELSRLARNAIEKVARNKWSDNCSEFQNALSRHFEMA